jgi:hypothetical protein
MTTVRVVSLSVPAGQDFSQVVRLVLGGIGSRVDLPLEDVDDLQLAVASIAGSARAGTMVLEAEIEETRLLVRVGPVDVDLATDPGLVRVLAPLVDRFEQTTRDDLGPLLVLEKSRRLGSV